MIHKSTPVHACTMAMGIVIMSVALLLLPMPSAFAAGGARPMMRPMPSRMAPPGAHASHAARIDPRIAEFNRELSAYKQTSAALHRDTELLMTQERRLDALINDLGVNGTQEQILLQELMDARSKFEQSLSNVMKAMNDTEKQIVHNMK